ncbi:hypothetical protein CDFC105_71455 [Clostridioides difficile]|nr:hypothetical protein CDFC105_63080 [Clostridioides difficile]CZS04256.1 hypothetical protein CDFC105_71455 [Clostridioides difficile]
MFYINIETVSNIKIAMNVIKTAKKINFFAVFFIINYLIL